MFDLQQNSLPRLVGEVPGFDDDPIESSALELLEPLLRLGPITGHRGDMERRRDVQRFQYCPPLRLTLGHEGVTPHRKNVEGDIGRRVIGGQFGDLPAARLTARPDPLTQKFEPEPPLTCDHQFAVEHNRFGKRTGGGCHDLGKAISEIFAVAGLQDDAVPILEYQAAEPVPLRLEQQVPTRRVRHGGTGRLGQHR